MGSAHCRLQTARQRAVQDLHCRHSPDRGACGRSRLCRHTPRHPDLVVWPEAPSPFIENDPRFQKATAAITQAEQAPLIIGGIGSDYSQDQQQWLDYNAAMVFAPDGNRVGRYEKIHLVPFGEYIPFQQYLTFAHKLTGQGLLVLARFRAHDLPPKRSPVRRLHLLRVRVCGRGAALRPAWGRGSGEHQRRWLVRRHERTMAAPQHGSHAGYRESPMAVARHQ